MKKKDPTGEKAGGATVTVRVEPEKAVRFNVGTRWEVVASSKESLWQAAHSITLKEIETGEGEA